MKNALTIDLEDYYHVSAFSEVMPMGQWNSQSSRVERNTNLLLDLLDEAGCKATFFTLGWVAEQHPQVVRRVAQRGHEVACHSLRHRVVYKMTRAEFRDDTRQAKQLLEDCSGTPVFGYRAPSFSITQDSLWALEVLAELGFKFDSSIFPVKHPNYGMPKASRDPHRIETPSGSIVEFPMTTLELAGLRSPFGGGAYFRLLPYWYTRWGIRFLNERECRSVCVYLHPWELDPEQPRMSGRLTSRMRHYLGLRSTPAKFRCLICDFEFCPLGALVDQV
ncbi:MAG TPA: XrtA system polysaccharide deacetylase [Candidatus Acidoferrum sp.]|nr:XrtA system polysaccharide deacetylase [Candidatus Acidoferrum sp.]